MYLVSVAMRLAVTDHHGPLKQEEDMLVSLKDLKGFSIQARDGEIGKVNDFYFDDQAWTVRYLVDRAGFWLFGRQVLISPASIREINSDQMIFFVELTRDQDGPGLKSSENVLGYHISTNNGDLGFVDDFIVSSKTWEIRYMVIDARKGLNGKKILIAPEWIDWISWKKQRVSVSMDKEKIQGCPDFDLSIPIGREYEELLYDHYECKKYWDDNAR